MALLSPLELADSEKLETLRRLDHFRHWRSLDDQRYCICCGTIVDGHSIQVVGGTRGQGPLRVICPTPRCPAIAMDWILPPDDVVARLPVATPLPTAVRVSRRSSGPESFWRSFQKFASQFRRAA